MKQNRVLSGCFLLFGVALFVLVRLKYVSGNSIQQALAVIGLVSVFLSATLFLLSPRSTVSGWKQTSEAGNLPRELMRRWIRSAHQSARVFRIMSLVLSCTIIVLGICWVLKPDSAPYEPIMAIIGALTTLIGVPTLVELSKPKGEGEARKKREETLVLSLDLLRSLEGGMGGVYPYIDAKLLARQHGTKDTTQFPHLNQIYGQYRALPTDALLLVEPIVGSWLQMNQPKIDRLWTLALRILSHGENEDRMTEYHELASEVSDSYWNLVTSLKDEYRQSQQGMA